MSFITADGGIRRLRPKLLTGCTGAAKLVPSMSTVHQSFDQLLDLLMTGKEELATRTLAKEGFQGIPNEESTSSEMIAALFKS